MFIHSITGMCMFLGGNLVIWFIVDSIADGKMKNNKIVEIDVPNDATLNSAGNYQFCSDDRPMAWVLANWVCSVVSHSFASLQLPSA